MQKAQMSLENIKNVFQNFKVKLCKNPMHFLEEEEYNN